MSQIKYNVKKFFYINTHSYDNENPGNGQDSEKKTTNQTHFNSHIQTPQMNFNWAKLRKKKSFFFKLNIPHGI